jgi:hypothetical protein
MPTTVTSKGQCRASRLSAMAGCAPMKKSGSYRQYFPTVDLVTL